MKEPVTSETIEIGAVFDSSWGYDQTNVDFYQLVGLSKSGQYGTFVKIGAQRVTNTSGGVRLVPDVENVLDAPMRRKLRFYSNTVYFSVCSYAVASLWDGAAKYDTLAAGEAGH